MALNIKNRKTLELAQKLARLTGESMTAAVTEALRERLERLQCGQPDGLADRLLKIGRGCAGYLRAPYRTLAHGDLLDDEKGRPRT
jgi:antitoxin VapB